jgi:hypothetical protein
MGMRAIAVVVDGTLLGVAVGFVMEYLRYPTKGKERLIRSRRLKYMAIDDPKDVPVCGVCGDQDDNCPACSEPNICENCGHEGDLWFSREIPMSYHCEKCGAKDGLKVLELEEELDKNPWEVGDTVQDESGQFTLQNAHEARIMNFGFNWGKGVGKKQAYNDIKELFEDE